VHTAVHSETNFPCHTSGTTVTPQGDICPKQADGTDLGIHSPVWWGLHELVEADHLPPGGGQSRLGVQIRHVWFSSGLQTIRVSTANRKVPPPGITLLGSPTVLCTALQILSSGLFSVHRILRSFFCGLIKSSGIFSAHGSSIPHGPAPLQKEPFTD